MLPAGPGQAEREGQAEHRCLSRWSAQRILVPPLQAPRE